MKKAFLVVTYQIDNDRLKSILEQNKHDNTLDIIKFESGALRSLESSNALKRIKSQIILDEE